MLTQLLFLIGAAILGWVVYRHIRHHPESFSRENLGKSFYTLGILALILIGFIGALILLLKA